MQDVYFTCAYISYLITVTQKKKTNQIKRDAFPVATTILSQFQTTEAAD